MAVTCRLDLRLSSEDRRKIDHAAALAGLPLTAFVRTAVLREVERTVRTQAAPMLSAAEARRFLAALRKPFAPNAALRRAMKRGDKLSL